MHRSVYYVTYIPTYIVYNSNIGIIIRYYGNVLFCWPIHHSACCATYVVYVCNVYHPLDSPLCMHIFNCLPFSGGLPAHAMSVSLVISSQISGYDGREFNMDTNESVELTFPIKVDQAGAYTCNFYDDIN